MTVGQHPRDAEVSDQDEVPDHDELRRYCARLIADEPDLRVLPHGWTPAGPLPADRGERAREILRQAIVAVVDQELAAAEQRVQLGRENRRGAQRGPSVVYTVRLARGQVEQLHREALRVGIQPSRLVRNYVTAGLEGAYEGARLGSAVTQVEEALADLRALVPRG